MPRAGRARCLTRIARNSWPFKRTARSSDADYDRRTTPGQTPDYGYGAAWHMHVHLRSALVST